MPNKVKFKSIKARQPAKNTKKVVSSNNRKKAKDPVSESLLRQMAKSFGALGGGALGALGGVPAAGSTIGQSLGSTISDWLGFGDYQVSSNSVLSGNIPMMHRTSSSTIIRHCEYIGDITSAGTASAFTVQPFTINPGNPVTFPWLSSIAGSYQEFNFKGLVFHYKSSTSTSIANSTNTTIGNIFMCTQYNSVSPAPLNKTEMLNEYFSSDAKVSENFAHPIECNPRENPFPVQYVSTGTVNDPPSNPLMYNVGNLYVGSQGVQGTGVKLGELWCTYEVELLKPHAINLVQNTLNPSCAGYATGVSNTAWFGTAQTFIGTDAFQPNFASNGIGFPAGNSGFYKMTYIAWGTSAATVALPTVTYTNANNWYSQYNQGFTAPLAITGNTGTQSILIMIICFSITDNTQSAAVQFTSSSGSTPGGTVSAQFWVDQVNYGINVVAA